ncbi:MAG: hypothetical protein KC910_10105, partial [Candidatus Eremiobacteraeota bacterium]|nr:hypothetical protein [Candidatus Eremiobacteraeota bacterium]
MLVLLALAPEACADSLEAITEQFLSESQPVRMLYPIECLVPGLDLSTGQLNSPANSRKVLDACRQRPELFRLLYFFIEPTPETQAEILERCDPGPTEVNDWLLFWSSKANRHGLSVAASQEMLELLARPGSREQAVRELLAGRPSPANLRLLLPWIVRVRLANDEIELPLDTIP